MTFVIDQTASKRFRLSCFQAFVRTLVVFALCCFAIFFAIIATHAARCRMPNMMLLVERSGGNMAVSRSLLCSPPTGSRFGGSCCWRPAAKGDVVKALASCTYSIPRSPQRHGCANRFLSVFPSLELPTKP